MSKKVINQNPNYKTELLNSVESKFNFTEKPINRFKNTEDNLKISPLNYNTNKEKELANLKKQINSIRDCDIKNNSRQIVLGYGNINSSIMIVAGAPGSEEEKNGQPFMGEAGELLKKMLISINIEKKNIYSTYAVNFRPPEDRKPTSFEIKKYSQFLQKHISIIKPSIVILMGSVAMESLTGLNNKISIERGEWKEVIVKNTSYSVIITFSPSYLLKVSENKKYSWQDLKKIKQKIADLKLKI